MALAGPPSGLLAGPYGENDLGCGFGADSALWSAVDAWQKCSGIQILEETPQRLSIRYRYAAPAMPGLETQVTYTVTEDCQMEAHIRYTGAPGRPELPLFGLRFETPQPVDEITWAGLSGETYPDRKKGGIFGIHREVPHIPAYLVPQECGCHMDTQELTLHRSGHALTVTKTTAPFAFSALPYTPHQLTGAHHREELPTPCRTTLTLRAAMRGLGGIDSWGSNVESPYRVSGEEDIQCSFRFQL